MTKRVLLYVQHLLGVGHVKRAAALCRGLTEADLDVTVAFGGVPVPNVTFANATVAHLPPARSADASFSALVDENGQNVNEQWWQHRERILLDLYDRTQPDIILVEHFPFGRRKFQRELIPLFERARTKPNIRIIGSVRDVLVASDDRVKMKKIVSMARTWFDAILVHGDANVLQLADTFPPASEIADLLTYTGYIVEPIDRDATASTDGQNEVIVSAGGGAVGAALFRIAMEARIAGCLSDRTWRFLAGSNLESAAVDELRASAPPDVIVESARPDFPQLLSRAALSISQAGYNTIMDLLVARCPAIVVPFATGGETEQTFRAEKFADAGLLTHLREKGLTARTLADAAHAVVSQQKPPTVRIDLNGVATTGRLVSEMVR